MMFQLSMTKISIYKIVHFVCLLNSGGQPKSLRLYEQMKPQSTSGLYYKHITIVIDAASVISK
jgi:hypothetical protein